jgi:hypothetical protein
MLTSSLITVGTTFTIECLFKVILFDFRYKYTINISLPSLSRSGVYSFEKMVKHRKSMHTSRIWKRILKASFAWVFTAHFFKNNNG